MTGEVKHMQWGGTAEFLIAALGFAVGLGNIWRFPSLVYKHGGGVFLIPYLLCLVLFGIPLALLEFGLGQFSSLGPTKVWKIAPIWKGLGWCAILQSYIAAAWYNAPISYGLYFLAMSMTSELPWKYCAEPWAAPNCLNVEIVNETSRQLAPRKLDLSNDTRITRPSEDYYYNHVLGLSPGLDVFGAFRWDLALCNAGAWLIVFLICIKGAQSLGKVAYFTSLFPYVILTIMLGFTASLDGAVDGIIEYVNPKWDRMSDPVLWKDAATQVFFSVGCGGGGLIALSSFNPFHNNIVRDSLLIPTLDGLTSIYSGFAVFSTLGFMAKMTNSTVADVVSSGPGLIFVTYPEALGLMEPAWVGVMMSILFFFMIVILGISSKIVSLETLGTVITDEIPSLAVGFWKPALVRFTLAASLWCFGLIYFFESGFYYVQMVDTEVIGWAVVVASLGEAFVISWVYGATTFWEDIQMMVGNKRFGRWFFEIAWRFVSPLVIIVIFCFNIATHKHLTTQVYIYDAYRYPEWYYAISVPLTVVPMLPIPLYFLYYLLKDIWREKLREGNTAKADWGPVDDENRSGRYLPKQVIKQFSMTGNDITRPDKFNKEIFMLQERAINGVLSSPESGEFSYHNNHNNSAINSNVTEKHAGGSISF